MSFQVVIGSILLLLRLGPSQAEDYQSPARLLPSTADHSEVRLSGFHQPTPTEDADSKTHNGWILDDGEGCINQHCDSSEDHLDLRSCRAVRGFHGAQKPSDFCVPNDERRKIGGPNESNENRS